jgi:hypothetical protein
VSDALALGLPFPGAGKDVERPFTPQFLHPFRQLNRHAVPFIHEKGRLVFGGLWGAVTALVTTLAPRPRMPAHAHRQVADEPGATGDLKSARCHEHWDQGCTKTKSPADEPPGVWHFSTLFNVAASGAQMTTGDRL